MQKGRKKNFVQLWWHLKGLKGQKDARRAKMLITPNNPRYSLKIYFGVSSSFGLFGSELSRTKFFFRPCGHAASIWPEMAAVAKFLCQNSHFLDKGWLKKISGPEMSWTGNVELGKLKITWNKKKQFWKNQVRAVFVVNHSSLKINKNQRHPMSNSPKFASNTYYHLAFSIICQLVLSDCTIY